jgi:chemotaxis protein MotA
MKGVLIPMNILALSSLIATISLVLSGIILGGTPGAFVNIPSIFVVIGGTLGATALATPKKEIKKVPGTLRMVFEKEENYDLVNVMKMIMSMARKARSEGLLALEEEVTKIEDLFIRKSAQLVIDGTPPELVKSIMEAEIYMLERRMDMSKKPFDLIGELAPAFGMLGTLIGLIQMLRNLDTPEALGPGMALALITTFYGSFIANTFAIPVARKLEARKIETVTSMEIAVEGILSIQAGENPRLIEEKLKVFLSSEDLERLNEKENSKAGPSFNATEEAADLTN